MLEKLNERERLMLFLLLGVALLAAIFFGGTRVAAVRKKISKDVAKARTQVVQMERLRTAIQSLPTAKSLPDMNRFIEQTTSLMNRHELNASDIRNRMDTSSRTEDVMIVELSFSGAQLHPIMRFLHDVEYGGAINARVGSLIFRKPLPRREIYDVRLSLTIRRPKEK